MDENKHEYDLNDIGNLDKYRHYSDDFDSQDDLNEPAQQENKLQFEDISSYSDADNEFYRGKSFNNREDEVQEPSENKKNKYGDKNFFSANNYKNTKIIALCVVIALLLGLGGGLYYIVDSTKGADYSNEGIDVNDSDEEPIEEENLNFTQMGDVDASSLNDFLYKWANNGGEKMYSKNVINVLLCGVDSKSGSADDGGSDSMILISVNRKAKKITMCSLLRDSWTYIKAPRADGTTYDYYFKLNAAYRRGGPATLLETIENNFKIEIDQYIAVDFVSFPKLIDALGGVTVNVQEYEAEYIRRTSSQKNFPIGEATLNGKQALIYSRIRKSDSDSDVSRTRRQRSVIKGLIASAKKATNGQLLNAFKQTAQYLRTGYSQGEVLKLIASAYTYKWMDYEMVELMLPNEDYVDRLSTYIGDQSAWVVDYALCAQKLQKAIYGDTNIILSDDRISALDLVTNRDKYTTNSNNNYSNGSSGGNKTSYSYNQDNNDYEYNNDDNGTDYDEPSSDVQPTENISHNSTLPDYDNEDNGNETPNDNGGEASQAVNEE